jgi:large subunit ribosomal protein L4
MAIKAATIGKQAKSEVPETVFSEPFNESLVHETARAELNARRQGTHSSLTRGEVAMTGAKAWRQKGTGRARAGALSVPQRVGGGAAFGPKPRHYIGKVNRKARRKALRAALSVHAARDSLAVLPAASFDEPATGEAAEALVKWGARTPILIVVTGDEVAAAKSFRNIPRVAVASAEGVGVAEIVGARSLVVSEPSLEVLERRSAAVRRGNGDAPEAEAGGGS